MTKQEIEHQQLAYPTTKFIQKQQVVSLKTVIKEVLMHLYCRGVLPKSVTQNFLNILKLRKH